MRAGGALLAGALAVVALGAWALSRDAGVGGRGVPAPDDAGAVALGGEVYAALCAAYHGAALEGQPDWRSPGPDDLLPAPPHDATGHTWHHPDAVLFALTKEGPAAHVGGGHRSAMPGFAGTLSDGEILAVLSYIKSSWPGYCNLTSENSACGGAVRPCRGRPRQGRPIRVFHGAATRPWRRANGRAAGYGGRGALGTSDRARARRHRHGLRAGLRSGHADRA